MFEPLKSCRKGIHVYVQGDYSMTYKRFSVRFMNKKGYEAFSHMTPPDSTPTINSSDIQLLWAQLELISKGELCLLLTAGIFSLIQV